MVHRYTDLDSEPHGAHGLIRYFIADVPDTRRLYGRRMMRRLASRCVQCHFADVDRARVSRMHAAYRARKGPQ